MNEKKDIAKDFYLTMIIILFILLFITLIRLSKVETECQNQCNKQIKNFCGEQLIRGFPLTYNYTMEEIKENESQNHLQNTEESS